MSERNRATPWWLGGVVRPSVRGINAASMDAGRRAAAERHERALARVFSGEPILDNRGSFRAALGRDGETVIQRDTVIARYRNEDTALATLRASLAGVWAGMSRATAEVQPRKPKPNKPRALRSKARRATP
ncbi:MAG TPA: hypothetical protein VFP50_15335 [Anaeromyxobacteraceae bacterium]|nr:hypothetical protein [Anaeromyxobacteraceae bacterium]